LVEVIDWCDHMEVLAVGAFPDTPASDHAFAALRRVLLLQAS
jgi:hypothetical protein